MNWPSVELEILRECQDRALHREGIPMFLALVDERGEENPPEPVSEGTQNAAILDRLDHYRSVLGPSRREDDLGAMVNVLAVTAYEDFDRIASS